jgi:STE24 endopeptidase
MHLLTILAFAVVFWQAEEPGRWVVLAESNVWGTLAIVLAQPLLVGYAASWAARRATRLLARHRTDPEIAQHYHHRASLTLRTATFAFFAATVLLTPWPGWFQFGSVTPALQIVGDLIVLTPFVVTIMAVWVAVYPLERALRGPGVAEPDDGAGSGGGSWRFSAYLDFHVRHYLLIVAVPMTLILFAADMTRGYETQLQEWSGWFWTPDLILGLVAATVFVLAPAMLCYIWRTAPLKAGTLRGRLEALCARIGLKCREILVWKSDGIMINAAVMGLFAPVRYVLLSDALLATMGTRQIEAVFGHEAGHVRQHHIQHFLVFAFAGWVVVAGMMELLAHGAIALNLPTEPSGLAIQAFGVAATVLYWGFGFGWLSRRFERQADLFGALCATPPAADCRLPCAVHSGDKPADPGRGRICATGAALFASSLDRVAMLNGIPLEERSWRHSSIGSRIRFLSSVAGDPRRAENFARTIRRVKVAMLIVAVVGLIAAAGYLIAVAEPAILRLQSGEA